MKAILLSLEDVPIILVIFQCFLFSILLLIVNSGKRASNLFLSLFLIGFSLDALNTLIYWSPTIKVQFLSGAINIFLFLRFSNYLIAPMLYLYVKSIIYSDYAFTKRDALHLIPLALFPLYLVVLYSSYSDEQLLRSTKDYAILFNNPIFQVHLWAKDILYVSYSVFSYVLLYKYKERLKENYSNIDSVDHTWLKILIGGFLGIWTWDFMGYVLNLLDAPHWLGDKLGIAGNFFLFIFVNTLVVYNLAKSGIVRKLASSMVPSSSLVLAPENKEQDASDQVTIEKLSKAMLEQKLFLDPELTIEQLAEHTNLSTRKISNTINRNFNQNFYDYINYYRIEQAKEILTKAGQHASMLEVMAEAGFNSKSTFYRAFKKQLNLTPTQFCQSIIKKQQS